MRGNGVRGMRWRGPALLMTVAALGGCSDAATDPLLAHGEASKEALVRSVLAAVERHDTAAIRAHRLTREEYETLLWPEMPDREQMPFDFAWSLTEPRSRKGLREVMARLGGVPLELVSVDFEKEPEVYPSFTLHRGVRVLGRRTDTGEEGVLTFFDVLVEYEGAWKLMDIDEL